MKTKFKIAARFIAPALVALLLVAASRGAEFSRDDPGEGA